MKKAIFTSLLFFSFFAYTQELSEEYLESLPESIKDDVKGKMKASQKTEEPIYRSASSKIDKSDLTMIDDKDDETEETKLSIFGEKFFDTIQSSFMPINEPNLDGSYILDYGDVIELQLIGVENSTKKYVVKRDGSINIEDIGKIYLSGLSLDSASKLIKAKVGNSFIGTDAFISLTNIRDVTILVSGHAYNPGIYTLNGNSRILHALNMAGGIDEFGSYRIIKHLRDGDVIDVLDLYDILISGKLVFNKSVRTGDVILVTPRKKLVSIEAGVLRPSKYEMIEGEDFEDLIRYASGLNSNVNKENIVLKRFANGKSIVSLFNYDNLKDKILEDNDSFFIREFKFNNVKISGAIKNPGTYLLPIGSKLSELIDMTGGYEKTAYPFGGFLNNQKALKINKESKQKLYDKFLTNLIESGASGIIGTQQETLPLILKQIKDSPVSGRVIAEFDLKILKSNPDLDTILEEGDEILIPNLTQQVYIQGEVNNPGAVRYSEMKDHSYYINVSGGLLNSADKKTIFVIHPNGETQNLKIDTYALSLMARSQNDLIYPGSIIYVPKASRADGLELAAIWAPIVSSVALSLTSISLLNKN